MYNFIINTGMKFRLSVMKICKRFIENENFPSCFDKTTLIQLPKKGSQVDLDNSRFIHLKLWMPRLCEALTVGRMKDKILEAGSKFQIGGVPGQRTQFHLFVIKSLIAARTAEGEGCVLTAVDIRKFFDKQSLVDAMNTLHQAKVKSKWYRVWYKLNENTKIQVKTGAGLSSQGLAGPVTCQGGGGAALASALNLDRGLDMYFRGSKDEECYGRVRLQPLTYIDDIMRGSKDINCLRAGNVKLDCVLRQKQLEAHPSKSCYLIFGSDKFKAKAQHECAEKPVMLGRIIMKEKKCEAYLGDILSSEGLRESIEATIKDRIARV